MIKQGIKTRLAPFGREHFKKWIEWQEDPENLDFFRNFNFPLSIDEMEMFYTSSVLGQFDKKFFVIYSIKENAPIGMIHLIEINRQARKLEIGILIGEKGFRGKGHAFDALVVLCDYIFNRLNLNKVYIRIMESNKRLIQFCKRGGFEVEGVLKEEVFQDGDFHNQVYLALFRKTFIDKYKNYFKDPSLSVSKRLKVIRMPV